MNRPTYLNSRIRNDHDRLNREARMYKDAGLFVLLVFAVIVAVWLCN